MFFSKKFGGFEKSFGSRSKRVKAVVSGLQAQNWCRRALTRLPCGPKRHVPGFNELGKHFRKSDKQLKIEVWFSSSNYRIGRVGKQPASLPVFDSDGPIECRSRWLPAGHSGTTAEHLKHTSICLMDHGGLDLGSCLRPTIHTLCHTHWMCCNSVMIHSGHMTSIVFSILERDPPLALLKGSSLFFPWKGFFYFLGVVPDPMWGQRSGMSMYTDCKALWGEFVFCDNGLYKINCIELNNMEVKGLLVIAYFKSMRW